MNPESYNQARNTAVKDLADAVNQMKLIEQRIARLKQTIASLDALIEGEEAAVSETTKQTQVGITQACREALKIANGPRTAKEIRDWLANSGYELSEQENALASIHTVLKRLVKAGEAATATSKEGKATYEWIGERGNAFTTAIQQANYEAASRVTEMVRQMMAGPALEGAQTARRILEEQAAKASSFDHVKAIDAQIRKAVESAKKKD